MTMLPAVRAPSPDFREAKSVIANYVEALARALPPRVVVLSSMGANRTSGLEMITALSLLGEGLRHLTLPIAYVRAGGFFENFLYGLHAAQDGTLPVYYNPTSRSSTMVATDDIGAEVATLLTGPVWSGQRDVKAFAIPRDGWPAAFEQFGIRRATPNRPKRCSMPSTRAGWTSASRARSTSRARHRLAMSLRRPARPPRHEQSRSCRLVDRRPH
jgi:hypothetical protein